jgi:hypothetical protein
MTRARFEWNLSFGTIEDYEGTIVGHESGPGGSAVSVSPSVYSTDYPDKGDTLPQR